MERKALYIGVMSGTSLDGIDTALVEVSPEKTTFIIGDTTPMPPAIKQSILSLALGQKTDLPTIGVLDNALGHLYAEAVLQLLSKASLSSSDITAIGNHGQTVFHQPTSPTPFTMQLGDANIIAARTTITTVADFRRKDMALGGQGAPLVPAFHQTLFSSKDSTTVVVNIGGIANISVLQPAKATIGYDTGPGNMLLDAWIGQSIGQRYDKDGAYALSGDVIPELLSSLLADAYFHTPSPKSTGREYFNLHWLEQHLTKLRVTPLSQDVQATLTELTAISIANEIKRYQTGLQPECLVCGGGARNQHLMERIKLHLPNWRTDTTDSKGISSEYMEAIAFAWLAYRRVNNLTSNLPEVTGASKAASLGVIYPAD